MRRKVPSPLPTRHGLDAVRLRTPAETSWATMRDHLVARLPRVDPARIDAMLREQRFVDRNGPIPPDAPYVPESFIWFHRDLPDEVPVPFEIAIVHRDEHLLVIDKPHFLATIPRGRHIAESALVRLRRDLDLPALSPAHRLDRATAGLLMFVITPERRREYQMLFRDRQVHKTYEAVARHDPSLTLPRTVRSRIIKERGVICATEASGAVNAVTRVELLERRAEPGAGTLARYRLVPETGRTHQLRVHMAGLGVPILGDDLYPVLTEKPLSDFSRPLQLLARTLEFRDPVTGEDHSFRSGLRLTAWDAYAEWA
jgi:tRNA pseudouridine32 synthase/23S rRNA pseudouridine746 synthase